MSEHASARGRWIGLGLGVPIMAWGVRGILADAADTRPGDLARWIVASAVVHDLLVVPLVLAVAVALRRVLPASWWPSVRWGLATSAVLVLIAWPFERGYGRDPDNPSVLPRDYGEGLAVAVAAVWIGVAVWIAVGALRRRRRGASAAA